jgi:hypothetical protein
MEGFEWHRKPGLRQGLPGADHAVGASEVVWVAKNSSGWLLDEKRRVQGGNVVQG